VLHANVPNAPPASFAFQYTVGPPGLAAVQASLPANASIPKAIDGHVDARRSWMFGVMNGLPAP